VLISIILSVRTKVLILFANKYLAIMVDYNRVWELLKN
jgi:hypothetical protein